MAEAHDLPGPGDLCEPFSDLDPLTGALPTDPHHVVTRGADVRLINAPANVVGLSHDTHRLRHDTGVEIPGRPSLYSLYF